MENWEVESEIEWAEKYTREQTIKEYTQKLIDKFIPDFYCLDSEALQNCNTYKMIMEIVEEMKKNT